jgi:hypothetical protein
MSFVFGIFIMLHGLVHLLYFGHSAKFFELKPGMLWPNGSWAFSRLLSNEAARTLASISLILAAMGLLVGGIGMLASQAWWRPVVVGAAAFSALVYIFFWNGRMQSLDAQGAVGILIAIAILLVELRADAPKKQVERILSYGQLVTSASWLVPLHRDFDCLIKSGRGIEDEE